MNKRLLFSGGAVILLFLTAVLSPWLCPYDPARQDYTAVLLPPSFSHPFGTDRFGRDMLSRVLAGSRLSLFSTLILVLTAATAGTCIGLFCCFSCRAADLAVMRAADIFLAFPGMVFALAAAAVLGGGTGNAVLALALVSWPKYARLSRSRAMSLNREPFMLAARMAGDTPVQLALRHLLPNMGGQILVTAALDMGTMMMELAALSFLGLGAQPPAAEWGSMMNGGRSMLQLYPWTVLTPGIGIFVSVAVFHSFGDALRAYMNPENRKKGVYGTIET